MEETKQPLQVVEHVHTDMLVDPEDMPQWEDDQHVFYPALAPGEQVEGTSHEELKGCAGFDPFLDNYFVLSRPEPDALERLNAVRRFFNCE